MSKRLDSWVIWHISRWAYQKSGGQSAASLECVKCLICGNSNKQWDLFVSIGNQPSGISSWTNLEFYLCWIQMHLQEERSRYQVLFVQSAGTLFAMGNHWLKEQERGLTWQLSVRYENLLIQTTNCPPTNWTPSCSLWCDADEQDLTPRQLEYSLKNGIEIISCHRQWSHVASTHPLLGWNYQSTSH